MASIQMELLAGPEGGASHRERCIHRFIYQRCHETYEKTEVTKKETIYKNINNASLLAQFLIHGTFTSRWRIVIVGLWGKNIVMLWLHMRVRACAHQIVFSFFIIIARQLVRQCGMRFTFAFTTYQSLHAMLHIYTHRFNGDGPVWRHRSSERAYDWNDTQ